MSYAIERTKVGHKPIDIIIISADACSLTYGISPCTATGSPGDECFNTRLTCQDVPNYDKTIKEAKFCTDMANPPAGYIPALKSVSISPTKVEVGSLGVRGSVSIKLKDFPHHDRGLDPYVDNRSYAPRGTFWSKYLARNRYLVGREVIYGKGFLPGSDVYQLTTEAGEILTTESSEALTTETLVFGNDFVENRTYIIEALSGALSITGKDRLKLADDNRVQIPIASDGTLLADINSSVTSLSVQSGEGATGAGDGVAYAPSGTLRVGSEEMTYTRSTDVFTVVRGVNGTEAKEHKADDTVQECHIFIGNGVDILHDILVNHIGIGESKVPYDAGLTTPTGTDDIWDDEKGNWLSSYNYERTVSDPTGTGTLIKQLLLEMNCLMWHDLVADEIILKSNSPNLSNLGINVYTDDNFIEGSVSRKILEDKRVSRCWVHFNKTDNSKSDTNRQNYSIVYADIDATSEGVDLYGTKKVVRFYAPWTRVQALASTLAGRTINRFSQSPSLIKFSLWAKDANLGIGELLDISSHEIQDVTGANELHRSQIISIKEDGSKFHYESISSHYTDKYAFWVPSGVLNAAVDISEATDTSFEFKNTGGYDFGQLEDSGTLYFVDGEEVTYTGKNGNYAIGITRGANGSTAVAKVEYASASNTPDFAFASENQKQTLAFYDNDYRYI